MHKTMLAALFASASALGIPAFAQVNLGGTAQAGVGVQGDAVPGALHAPDPTGARSAQILHRADHRARHLSHKTMRETRPVTATDQSSANVSAGSVGDADSRTATGQSVGADAKVNARAAAHEH
jgi:hypothetical protein